MLLRLVSVVAHLALALAVVAQPASQPSSVEQWGVFELSLDGPKDGNPFETKLTATFKSGSTEVKVPGFYDGDGIYRVRFMPPSQGKWTYATTCDTAALNGKAGEFQATKPSPGNHGPVRTRGMYHFAYADGTPFIPISTTLYGWAHQKSDELQDQTVETLKASPFNRIRMCVTPIAYGDDNVPRFFPFQEKADESWIYERFVPQFFQRVEKRIVQLRDLGIEAELILFHNRDGRRLELDRMPDAADDRFIRYCIARFSAYRNIWWNLANEFDSLRFKRDTDWDRFFEILQKEDPHQRLRSVHQMRRYYDVMKPWVTHLSVQSELAVTGLGRPVVYRQLFRKPIVFDEPKYEGDIPETWGNLSGEEMTYRFWICTIGGTYATHGETYESAPGIRWISRGGKLVGKSPERIKFLREVLEAAPPGGLTPVDPDQIEQGIASAPGGYYLVYFGKAKPTEWKFAGLDGVRTGQKFKVEVLDTWNMTVTPVEQVYTVGQRQGEDEFAVDPPVSVPLPGRPYMALRVQRVPQ